MGDGREIRVLGPRVKPFARASPFVFSVIVVNNPSLRRYSKYLLAVPRVAVHTIHAHAQGVHFRRSVGDLPVCVFTREPTVCWYIYIYIYNLYKKIWKISVRTPLNAMVCTNDCGRTSFWILRWRRPSGTPCMRVIGSRWWRSPAHTERR